MNLAKTITVIALTAGGSLWTAAGAAEMSSDQMAQELQSLKAEVAQLRAQQNENWMTEARAAQVKALVKEVLADADTRKSLTESGVSAGHDKRGFYLSGDNFFLNIGGQLQVRYVANTRDNNGDVNGFELRRGKVWFQGYAMDPKLTYKIQLVNSRTADSTASIYTEDLWVAYQLTDDLKVTGGRFQDRFGREAWMSSKKSQTVDRSFVVNKFANNDNFVEGIAVDWAASDMFHFGASFNDGLKSGDKGAGFSADNSSWAFSGRVDAKLSGDSWKAADDVEAWSDFDGKGLQAFIGAGVHYQDVRDNSGAAGAPISMPSGFTYDKLLTWTVDGLAKFEGLGVMGAFYGVHTEGTGANQDSDNYAATVQAGYMVIPDKLEPFVRYEWISPDSDITGSHDISILTFGANYFFKKHDAKFTADVVWCMDPLDVSALGLNGETGVGLLGDATGQDGQLAFRAQFQLLF